MEACRLYERPACCETKDQDHELPNDVIEYHRLRPARSERVRVLGGQSARRSDEEVRLDVCGLRGAVRWLLPSLRVTRR